MVNIMKLHAECHYAECCCALCHGAKIFALLPLCSRLVVAVDGLPLVLLSPHLDGLNMLVAVLANLEKEFAFFYHLVAMRLCHPPDGSTNLEYKLLCFKPP
jgi:hypothetical protein